MLDDNQIQDLTFDNIQFTDYYVKSSKSEWLLQTEEPFINCFHLDKNRVFKF